MQSRYLKEKEKIEQYGNRWLNRYALRFSSFASFLEFIHNFRVVMYF